jgi:hypothetical protein
MRKKELAEELVKINEKIDSIQKTYKEFTKDNLQYLMGEIAHLTTKLNVLFPDELNCPERIDMSWFENHPYRMYGSGSKEEQLYFSLVGILADCRQFVSEIGMKIVYNKFQKKDKNYLFKEIEFDFKILGSYKGSLIGFIILIVLFLFGYIPVYLLLKFIDQAF